MHSCDFFINNVHLAPMLGDSPSFIERGVIAITKGKISYIGTPENCRFEARNQIDADGQWLLPGFIDCHTHLVHAGNRSKEFDLRLQGVNYEEISRQGGGIKSTVKDTRQASEEALLKSALQRAKRLLEEGVTSIEIKSGYGLDLDTECKMLRVAKAIEEHLPVNIVTTYLGAHAVPSEFTDNPDGYIDFVCDTVIPVIARKKLASAVDVFCESIGFSPLQCERVYKTAQQHNLRIKAHVEQLSDLQGAVLACQYGADSVDHLEHLHPKDVPALTQHQSVAVIIPGAFYYLNEQKKPPIQALRDNKISMAVASDLNPGTSPIASLLTSANMASVLFGLTPYESLLGITKNAAKALNLKNKGVLAVGNDADFSLWNIQHPSDLIHTINYHRPTSTWIAGQYV